MQVGLAQSFVVKESVMQLAEHLSALIYNNINTCYFFSSMLLSKLSPYDLSVVLILHSSVNFSAIATINNHPASKKRCSTGGPNKHSPPEVLPVLKTKLNI